MIALDLEPNQTYNLNNLNNLNNSNNLNNLIIIMITKKFVEEIF